VTATLQAPTPAVLAPFRRLPVKRRKHRLFKGVSVIALSAVAGLVLAVGALPAVGGLGAGAKASADMFNNLPTALVMPPLAQRSVLLDRDGNRLAVLHGTEDRITVPLSRIPKVMRTAIVDIEDSRFYEHHGVDYKGVVRAAVTNQQTGEVSQGGSTLTQQYVKNVLLESASDDTSRKRASERSFPRKLREARYALALEHRLTKDQILANYLNIAYFGDGAYGVATAAQHYFGIEVEHLTLDQAALLAGLVKNPFQYDPKRHVAAARARRDVVLARMHELGHAPTKQWTAARRAPVVVRSDSPPSDSCETAGSAAFFCSYVIRNLLADPKFGPNPQARQHRLFDGGLSIRTSLDPKIQAAAQSSVDSVIPSGSRVATASVVLRPGTGEVLAMAINRVYADTSDHRTVETTADRVHTKFNYAAQGSFQPGSTFKMFTLSAALDRGLPLSTTIMAPPCYESHVLSNPTASTCPAGPATPDGYGYQNAEAGEGGTFPMDVATWQSVNTYFVQLEEQVGVLRVRDMAQRLGVRSPRLRTVGPGDGSLTLGGFEVSPLDMATAYATIAAHGKRCWPTAIAAVSAGAKAVAYTDAPGPCEQVIKPGLADSVSSVLQGVITSGTAAANGQIGRPAAGKTGTTDEHRSAWFVGFVPQLTTAVWVGDYRSPTNFPLKVSPTTPEGTPVAANGYDGNAVFGGGLPTMVWAATMRAALEGVPVIPLPPPDPGVTGGVSTGVPPVSGLAVDAAVVTLRAAGFDAVDGGVVNSTAPAGTVAWVYPSEQVLPGTRILVYSSSGYIPPAVVAPAAPPVAAGPVAPPPAAPQPPAPQPPAAAPSVKAVPQPAATATATATVKAPAPKPSSRKVTIRPTTPPKKQRKG